jgi:hypothetical protein
MPWLKGEGDCEHEKDRTGNMAGHMPDCGMHRYANDGPRRRLESRAKNKKPS